MHDSNIQHKQYYYGIDIVKFLCALLIVFTHTYCGDWGAPGHWFKEVVTTIGVPFFFIASGFFYTRKLLSSDDTKQTQRLYFKRIMVMYLFWSIVTLPISWYMIIGRAHPDYSLPMKLVYQIRLCIFTGSIGIYWYLLSLLYCSILLYLAHRFNKIKFLYCLAIVGFVIGAIYNSPYRGDQTLFRLIHAIFGSERNFLNVGLFYMCIGHYFAAHTYIRKATWCAVLVLCVVLRSAEYYIIGTNVLQAAVAIIAFIIAVNLTSTNMARKISPELRKLSTAIYLWQFPFILCFDYYLQRTTAIDFCTTVIFCIMAYYITERLLTKNWYKIIYG